MNENRILIKKMSDYDRNVRHDLARVFVDGYYKDLSFFTKDRGKLSAAFLNAFCPEVFYLAEMNEKIVGMLACSYDRHRGVNVMKPDMIRNFGFMKGSLGYHILKEELGAPLHYPDDTAYIECVATIKAVRGKGVGTALFRYVLENLPYRIFILEVSDVNHNAYRLYKKLGFEEFKRKREKHPILKGHKESIFMRWERGDL